MSFLLQTSATGVAVPSTPTKIGKAFYEEIYATAPLSPLPIGESREDENQNCTLLFAIQCVEAYFGEEENKKILQFYKAIIDEESKEVRTYLKDEPKFLMKTLIELGRDNNLNHTIGLSEFVGGSALHTIALLHTNTKTLDVILKESDEKSLSIIINKKNQEGFTPLHCAFSRGDRVDPDIVKALIKAGAELAMNVDRGTQTCLHLLFKARVIFQPQFDCLDLALKFHPDSIRFRNRINEILTVPLKVNFPRELAELVKSYLPAYCPAAVNTPNQNGSTPLSFAIEDKTPSIDSIDTTKKRPHAQAQRIKALFILLNAGGNPLLPYRGCSILEKAFKHGFPGSYQLMRTYCETEGLASAKDLAEIDAKVRGEKPLKPSPKASNSHSERVIA